MDEKNEELVDAQIVEQDGRTYGHAEGEPRQPSALLRCMPA